MDAETQRTIEAVYRIESPRLIASLTRLVRDVGVAEELAQDALVAAMRQWPETGVPERPGAWLMATARRRAIDGLRRRSVSERKYAEVARALETLPREDEQGAVDAAVSGELGDDLLRLMFVACHPVLPTEARVALTLRLLGGLTTDEIARAFLVKESTIAQRIVRAKRTLAAAEVPFEIPRGGDLAERVSSVLGVIYLVFNEGYAATAGDDWMRPELCADALRLGRVLAELLPDEPEVHGLVALMEFQASRTRARLGPPKPRPTGIATTSRTTPTSVRTSRKIATASKTKTAARSATRTPTGSRTKSMLVRSSPASPTRTRRATGARRRS